MQIVAPELKLPLDPLGSWEASSPPEAGFAAHLAGHIWDTGGAQH